MDRVTPIYLRDEATQEYRAQVPGHPGRFVRAATLHDLRRKLRAAEQDDAETARSGLVAPSRAWDQPYDPDGDTVFEMRV